MSTAVIRGFAAMCALLVATAAHADAWSIVVINKTGKAVSSFEIAVSPNSVWSNGSQVSMPGTLQNGAQAVIHFDRADGSCRYDLRATFTDAKTAIYSKINICDNSYVTIKLSNNMPVYSTN